MTLVIKKEFEVFENYPLTLKLTIQNSWESWDKVGAFGTNT